MDQIQKDNASHNGKWAALSDVKFRQLFSFDLIQNNVTDQASAAKVRKSLKKAIDELPEIQRCACRPKKFLQTTCGDDDSDDEEKCINQRNYCECGHHCCSKPEGRCLNRGLTDRASRKVIMVSCGDAGFGIITREYIPKGSLIMEYIGVLYLSKDNPHNGRSAYATAIYYDEARKMEIVIDATSKGNISRYFQHSHKANCSAKVMKVGDALRMGIYALTTIPPGAQLTLDYGDDFRKLGVKQCECTELETCSDVLKMLHQRTKTLTDMCQVAQIPDEARQLLENARENRKEILKKYRDDPCIKDLILQSLSRKMADARRLSLPCSVPKVKRVPQLLTVTLRTHTIIIDVVMLSFAGVNTTVKKIRMKKTTTPTIAALPEGDHKTKRMPCPKKTIPRSSWTIAHLSITEHIPKKKLGSAGPFPSTTIAPSTTPPKTTPESTTPPKTTPESTTPPKTTPESPESPELPELPESHQTSPELPELPELPESHQTSPESHQTSQETSATVLRKDCSSLATVYLSIDGQSPLKPPQTNRPQHSDPSTFPPLQRLPLFQINSSEHQYVSPCLEVSRAVSPFSPLEQYIHTPYSPLDSPGSPRGSFPSPRRVQQEQPESPQPSPSLSSTVPCISPLSRPPTPQVAGEEPPPSASTTTPQSTNIHTDERPVSAEDPAVPCDPIITRRKRRYGTRDEPVVGSLEFVETTKAATATITSSVIPASASNKKRPLEAISGEAWIAKKLRTISPDICDLQSEQPGSSGPSSSSSSAAVRPQATIVRGKVIRTTTTTTSTTKGKEQQQQQQQEQGQGQTTPTNLPPPVVPAPVLRRTGRTTRPPPPPPPPPPPCSPPTGRAPKKLQSCQMEELLALPGPLKPTEKPTSFMSGPLWRQRSPLTGAARRRLNAMIDAAVEAARGIAREGHNLSEKGRRVGRQQNQEWQCGACPMTFNNIHRYRRHLESHVGAKLYPCSEPGCGKSFNSADNLRGHAKLHKGTQRERYACAQCGKDYGRRADVNAHMRKTTCPFQPCIVIPPPPSSHPQKQTNDDFSDSNDDED